jgi:hypothetical protein
LLSKAFGVALLCALWMFIGAYAGYKAGFREAEANADWVYHQMAEDGVLTIYPNGMMGYGDRCQP